MIRTRALLGLFCLAFGTTPIAAGEAVHLEMRVSGAFLPGTYFGRLQYGAAVEVRTAEHYSDYRFVAPLRGGLCATIAMRRFRAGRAQQC